MNRPELCARPGVSAKPPLLCHPLRLPSGAWELTLQPGFPDTPCIHGPQCWACGALAAGFRVSPTTSGGGRWSGYHTIPYPTFGTDSQGTSSLTCPGRPTVNYPQVPPRVCGLGSDDSLSAAALPVECRASADFPAHAASPAT